MEEQKPTGRQISIWQWQSDKDPYEENDETNWKWQDYPYDSCLILEKALRLKQAIADLGDYEVDLKRMVQVNKKDKNRVRRVRRQSNKSDQSRLMSEMPEPVVISSDEKTMNQAFGTVQHFLEYMMKRTRESYRLYQSLKNMSLDSQEAELKNIIDEVILCIKKGAEARERIVKTRSEPWNQNHIREAEKIVLELKNNSRNLRDFLQTILKIYTMETFVCYWLNELLRNDSWTEINVLTPYLVCLTYTFKLSDYTVKYEGGLLNKVRGYWNNLKLKLYRGSALTPEQLAQYEIAKGEYFSWNCVTSTSRSPDVALLFAHQSLIKAEEQNIAKEGIVFIIEADFGSIAIEDCEGMIDVAKNSKFPHEQEVILAPGTVFELGKIQLNNKNKIYEINLKAKRKFEKVTQNIPLLGALQDQAISKDKAVIEGIPSADSFRLLQLLEGNKLIEELEIVNSEIEEHIMRKIGKVRESTDLNEQDIKLRNNILYVSSFSVLAHYFSQENLNNVLFANNIICKSGKVRDDWKMKRLVLEEKVLQEYIENPEQFQHLLATLKNEDKITELSLLTKNLIISDHDLTLGINEISSFS